MQEAFAKIAIYFTKCQYYQVPEGLKLNFLLYHLAKILKSSSFFKTLTIIFIFDTLFIFPLNANESKRLCNIPSKSQISLPDCEQKAIESTLILLDGDNTELITVDEYVARVLACEIPYTFHSEALKAQAIAARTYLYYHITNGTHSHKNSDVCTDFHHCCGYTSPETLEAKYGKEYSDKAMEVFRNAARLTSGEFLLYNGKYLLALWHASSDGKTEDSSAVWGGTYPYLVSVSSPEIAENYVVSFTFQNAIKLLAADGYIVSNNNLKTLYSERTPSGRCGSVSFGKTTIKGTEIRTIFGLKSTDFTVWSWGGRLYFFVKGYGHGVGMSQEGAQKMAVMGYNCHEILSHYYEGCTFKKYN